jgi:hypothetical protein
MTTTAKIRTQVRGRPGGASLLSSGGPTSAGKLNKRVGVPESERFVTVEHGRRISVYELCRSVSEAAGRALRRRGMEVGA